MAQGASREPFMARIIAAFVALLLLAGCESDDDFFQQTGSAVTDVFGSSDATTTAAAATAPPDERCIAVAYARRADAKANGFEDEMLAEVYNRTYAECTTWDRDHTEARQSN